MKIYLISDTHFYHEAVIKFCDRPEDFTEQIIKNLKSTLHDDDILIHLGDIIFKRAGSLQQILNQIPGRKWLVRGNHDQEKINWYLSHGFDFAGDQIMVNKIIFSHVPIIVPKDYINIHGHLHNTNHRRGVNEAIYPESGKRYLFACEYTDYKPVELNQFLGEEVYKEFMKDRYYGKLELNN